MNYDSVGPIENGFNNHKIIPKKSLGQNFLTSQAAISKIVQAGELKSGDLVLEIGPGTGVLTEQLLASNQIKVIAVEKDDRLIEYLTEKFTSEITAGRFKIWHKDILELSLEELELAGVEYSLVANIPYYITGQILRKFLENKFQPKLMVVLLQKEVAERILARDGKESLLSVSVKIFGEPKIVSVVKAGSFNPPPKVDSAILQIKNISMKNFQPFGLSTEDFFEIIKVGFAHKRKTLWSNLRDRFPETQMEQVWQNLKLDKRVRAEELKTDKWLALVLALLK